MRFFFEFFIAVVAVFYLLRDGPALIGFMRDTSPFDEESTELIISGVASSVTTSFQSNVVTALAQGTLAGIIFWVLVGYRRLFSGQSLQASWLSCR